MMNCSSCGSPHMALVWFTRHTLFEGKEETSETFDYMADCQECYEEMQGLSDAEAMELLEQNRKGILD
jgi:hypothetical protein